MSERPTPETDAACWSEGYGLNSEIVLAEFARKLERERDEAREERDKLKQLLAADSENVDAYLGLCIERDEAREKYDNLATEHMLAVNKICNERDEARETAQQLIHIASHCLGWHENSNPETITEAIKRWNASTKK